MFIDMNPTWNVFSIQHMHRTLLTDRAFTTQIPYQRERFKSVLAPILRNLGIQLSAKEYALCLPLPPHTHLPDIVHLHTPNHHHYYTHHHPPSILRAVCCSIKNAFWWCEYGLLLQYTRT